jgi:hypothetical protein
MSYAQGRPSKEVRTHHAVLFVSERQITIIGLARLASGGSEPGSLNSGLTGESLRDVQLVAAFVWTYVHWQCSRLNDFSEELSLVVPADTTKHADEIQIARALRLMRDFLRFEALHWQVDIVLWAWAKELHKFYLELHSVREQFDEIRSEVSRVEGICQTTMQGRQNVLLSVVGAIQAVGAGVGAERSPHCKTIVTL